VRSHLIQKLPRYAAMLAQLLLGESRNSAVKVLPEWRLPERQTRARTRAHIAFPGRKQTAIRFTPVGLVVVAPIPFIRAFFPMFRHNEPVLMGHLMMPLATVTIHVNSSGIVNPEDQ